MAPELTTASGGAGAAGASPAPVSVLAPQASIAVPVAPGAMDAAGKRAPGAASAPG
jgi:hypothetical protein